MAEPEVVTASRVRTLEVRVAQLEDSVSILKKQTGFGFTMKERQALWFLTLAAILGPLAVRTTRKVEQ